MAGTKKGRAGRAGRAGSKKRASVDQPLYPRIYAIIRRIPRGKVASYGDIARRAGLANGARQVGYALHALPSGSTVPWQRVLGASGKISLPPGSHGAITQRILLEQEGVGFLVDGRVGERYWWGSR